MNKEKVTWIDEINEIKIIEIDEKDPRGFIVTNKTVKEVKEVLDRYNEKVKTKDKLIMRSTKEKNE